MYKNLKTIAFLFCVFFITKTQAQTSNLSVQGILRSAEGDAVDDGDYEITFKLYLQPNTGNPIWEETIEEVEVKGGIYSLTLGAGATPLNVPFDQPYFLGVTVEGGIELNPRARLTSSPYALSLIGDDNIFPNSGNVGVGAAAPQNKLTVQRGDGILGLETIEDANNTSTITTTADGMEFDAGGTDKIYAFPNGRIDATANEQFTIEGTDTAQLVFTKTSGSATLGFDAANGDDLKLSNPIGATKIEGTNITLIPSNGTATIEGTTTITKDGETLKLIGIDSSYVGLYPEGESAGRKSYIGFKDGSTDLEIRNEYASDSRIRVHNQLYLTGSRLGGLSGWRYMDAPHGEVYIAGNHTRAFGLYTDGGIRAGIYYADSDWRIKKDFRISNSQQDIQTLMNIEVTDYKHKDEVNHGSDYKKGLIAQQVKSVFPEAVSLTTGEIPNICEFPIAINSNNGEVSFQVSKPHDLVVGDRVKMISDEGDETYTISTVVNKTTFSVENFNGSSNTQEVFIYGKEVNDFHTVDYDRVFTLNVSATQELARQVEALKATLAAVQKENTELKSTITKTDDVLKSLKAEVASITQNLKMTGQK